MSLHEKATFEPDFDTECDNCSQTPTVTTISDSGEEHHTGLCGACCFGEAACIDPAEW